ncbi:MAG: DMT family transporter [Halanaeroarchaeum sp.]
MRHLEAGLTPRVTALLFLLLAAIWGVAFVAIEIGLQHFPPLYFAGLRYLVAGTLIVAYAAVTTDYVLPRNRRDLLRIAVLSVFFIFGNQAFLYLGQQYVSGAIAAVVVSLSPVLTAVLASLFLGDETLGRREAVGFLAGVVGVAIVANPTPGAFDATTVLGILLVLGSATSFALGGVLSHPIPTTIPLTSLQGWSMLVGSGLLFGAGALRGESVASISLTPTALVSFAYLALVSGAFAYLLYFVLLEAVGPAELNLVGYLEPVGATIAGWAILGELVGPTTAAGFALIVVGFALVKYDVLARRFGIRVPGIARLRKYV